MRIMHTSDWHLGKSIHGVNLDSDQEHVIEVIERELVDGGYSAVLIAGDIFDRALPPTPAMELLSGFLERTSARAIQVVMVPGNHDSPERLDFASGILKQCRVHLRCRYEDSDEPILISDGEDKVQVFCLPFVEEAEVKALFPEEGIQGHEEAVSFLVERMRERMTEGIPSILVAHEYTGRDVVSSESERELLLGNQGRIPSEVFSGFDYVALGHLHGPQTASKENKAIYSGSILQYSFSEWEHEKGIVRIEIEGGELRSESVRIHPRRRLVLIEDTLENILTDRRYDEFRDHYVGVRLTDTGPKFDIQVRLRERFPLLMDTVIVRKEQGEGPSAEKIRAAIDSPKELFSLFLDKFGWTDPEKRERASWFFDDARKRADHSFRRGSE
jgi:exonuclease SbcD